MDEKKVREAIDFIKTLMTAGNGDERLRTAIEALERESEKMKNYDLVLCQDLVQVKMRFSSS